MVEGSDDAGQVTAIAGDAEKATPPVADDNHATGMGDIPKQYLDLATSVAPRWTASVTKKR